MMDTVSYRDNIIINKHIEHILYFINKPESEELIYYILFASIYAESFFIIYDYIML